MGVSLSVPERWGDGAAGKQIWVMSADGRGGVSLGQGTSPRWSPDGKSIAFLRDNGIVLYDTKKKESRVLVAREEHRYTTLGDALAWESDGQRLALLATRPNFTELVLVSVPQNLGQHQLAEPVSGKGTEGSRNAEVTLDAQRGFASCRSVGQLSWGEKGICFAISPIMNTKATRQVSIKLWLPRSNGGSRSSARSFP